MNLEPRIAFADSRLALELAYAQGLPRNVEIRTTAPALTLDPDSGVTPPTSLVEAGPSLELGRATLNFCSDLHDRLHAHREFGGLAIVGAQLGMQFPTIVQKAMTLRDPDFESNVAIVRVRTTSESNDAICNMPWVELLKDNPHLKILEIDGATLPDILRRPLEHTRFIDRQRLGGWEKIGHQVVDGLWRRLPKASPRGTFLVLRENILLRETVVSLALRGYGISHINLPSDGSREVDYGRMNELKTVVTPAVREFVKDFVPEAAVLPLETMFAEQLGVRMAMYRHSLPYWRDVLDGVSPARPKAVLTNMLPRPELAALYQVCGERGLPMAAFQHGVAREIGANNWHIQAYFEGNTADVFYTFNDEAAKVSEACTFNRAKAVTVGAPASYWRCGNYRRPLAGRPPLIYAATNLYCGNMNMVAAAGVSDHTMAVTEMRLIDEVFAKLPHALLYKPYPNDRYLDEDPVVLRASSAHNIEVFRFRDDLSFLMPDCRVIITARGTSTVAWCATSGKPFVYIHYPYDKPLRPDARNAFEEAFFLFDGGAPDFSEKLRAFLSQPIEEIERLWAARLKVRKAIVSRFFGNEAHHAGSRAAKHLLDEVCVTA